ncbi:DNA oxidative demethylase ALKBH2-like isoform X2 [Sipha flava]|uniref:DNA oxidative demethylase ALKBH2 n=1 Tax=Sipha flava TaxID=143950 RepID=A0A8B8FXJ3_9HEMI|nr:DNA oxidative demethylase ALKBH2-like isoform X2 [Sipha flava]
MTTLYEKLMKNMNSPIRYHKIVAEGLDLDYYERFLTGPESSALMEYMENNVCYLDGRLTQVKVFGQYYPIPRQQVAFGDEGVSYKFSGTNVPALPWPQPLFELKNKICVARGVDYNFVLVNRNGEDHMGEHRDDEIELDKMVPIASVSLGQTRKFVFKHTDVRKKLRQIESVKLDLHNGSLLMMNWPTNEYWYHSIPKEIKANNVRLNFTFRKIK